MEENILDVRNVVPFERHRLIFETFNNLKEGENFILINDQILNHFIISLNMN